MTAAMQGICRSGISFFAALFVLGSFAVLSPQAAPGERFEVTSIKAVRPNLAATLDAAQQKNLPAARAAFQKYDSAWNGIEFYINTRSRDMYNVLEHEYQARIDKALASPNPDLAAVAADAQAMLGKFDEAVAMIEKAAPLNALYDDVARLRIVRANLREVVPALKAGDFDKARKSYEEFDNKWDSIEDLVKARSEDAYVAIEKGMIDIEKALMPDKPDVAAATALVNDVMNKYNEIVAQIAKEARASK